MSWARRKKKVKIAEGEKKVIDISMMTLVKCNGCGCHIKYTVNPPKEPQFCVDCEKIRKKHNIPW